MRSLITLLVVLTSPVWFWLPSHAFAPPTESADADEKFLSVAGYKADKAGLIDFFRKRSLTEEERKECDALVKQLGSPVFEERQQANKSLAARGPVVIPLLRPALKSSDPEVAQRAKECLETLEEADPGIPLAAARLLVRRAPVEALLVLVNYLPGTASEWEAQSYLKLIQETNKPDSLERIEEALADPFAPRRGAAAFALARKGTDAHRDKVRTLLADNDFLVRYRAAQGLLGAGDKAGVPSLVALLEEASPEVAGQAEEILWLKAGPEGPNVRLGSDPSADHRRRCRAAWVEWWKENEAKVDGKAYLEAEKAFGLVLGVEYNTGRVWECGLDKVMRWEIRGLNGPIEAYRLPDQLVLIAESGSRTVSVRDQKGNIRWEKKLDGLDGSVMGCQPLANGHSLVFTYNVPDKPLAPNGKKPQYLRNFVRELDAKGEELSCVELGGGASIATRRLPDGDIALLKGSHIYEIDAKGSKTERHFGNFPIARGTDLQELPGGRFIVASAKDGVVVEVSSLGKVLWKAEIPGACGVHRLPNGNTLVGTNKKVVELNDQGKTIWEMKTEGYVRRIHGW